MSLHYLAEYLEPSRLAVVNGWFFVPPCTIF